MLVLSMLVLLAVLWLYLRQVYSRFSKYGVRHLKPIPLLGNMARITLRVEHVALHNERIYNSFPGERFVGSYEFLTPTIYIRDLELIKKITVKHYEHFVDHRAIVDEDVDPFLGRNLFAMKGHKWRDMRLTLSPAFTSSKIRLMVPFMVEVGDQMIESLKKKILCTESGSIEVESKDLMMRYANDVIASCAFGLKVDSHTDEDNLFYEMGRAASVFGFIQHLKFIGFSSCPNLMKKFKLTIFTEEVTRFFKDLVLNTMNERDARQIVRNDMIHLLMEAKKGKLSHDTKVANDGAGFATAEEYNVGKRQNDRVWSTDDLIAQAVLFFIAGFETTSVAMTFLLYELALNPEIQDRLALEIRENHKVNEGKFDYSSIQQLNYLDMVVSESLRLWPPDVGLDRLCVKDFNLGKPSSDATRDYIIRKDEGIVIPMGAIQRDPEYFPDPTKFDPERFSDANKHNIKPFTYMPFGLGPRNCTASRFALCEMKIMVYQLLLHIELSPSEKTCIPIKLTTDTFNLRIKGGHWLRFKLRKGTLD
uniref:unspecific monooxygenase n=1 Tax=Zygaena filipendulae TaxID=287375 RepID=A0A286MXM7_9NEOP|nr:cytochrome P450 CYP9A74 [Zygaena filipendulae]